MAVNAYTAQSYSEEYVNECFAVWYQNGKPSMQKLAEIVPPHESGSSPSAATLRTWKNTFDWDVQYDLVEEKALQKFQERLAEDRAEMLMRHAANAKNLQEKALQYLEENDFENTNVALKALELGFDTERASRGLRGGVVNVFNMGDDQIAKELESLIGRLSSKDVSVVDGEVIEDMDGLSEE